MGQLLDSYKDLPWPMVVSIGIHLGSTGLVSLLAVILGVYAWRSDALSGGLMVGSGIMKAVLPAVSMVANSLVSAMLLTSPYSSSTTDNWYFWSAIVQGALSLIALAVELAFLGAVARLVGLRLAGRFVSEDER